MTAAPCVDYNERNLFKSSEFEEQSPVLYITSLMKVHPNHGNLLYQFEHSVIVYLFPRMLAVLQPRGIYMILTTMKSLKEPVSCIYN